MADNKTTKDITIQGIEVTVSVPFAVGHACTAAEAKALNQVRAENVRNNCAKFIKGIKDKATKDEEGKITLSSAQLSEIAKHVEAYDKDYEFSLATVAGKLSPLEKEANSIARAHVTAQIKAQGKNVKDIDKETIESNVAVFAEHPEVIKLAKKRLADKAKLADDALPQVAL